MPGKNFLFYLIFLEDFLVNALDDLPTQQDKACLSKYLVSIHIMYDNYDIDLKFWRGET